MLPRLPLVTRLCKRRPPLWATFRAPRHAAPAHFHFGRALLNASAYGGIPPQSFAPRPSPCPMYFPGAVTSFGMYVVYSNFMKWYYACLLALCLRNELPLCQADSLDLFLLYTLPHVCDCFTNGTRTLVWCMRFYSRPQVAAIMTFGFDHFLMSAKIA